MHIKKINIFLVLLFFASLFSCSNSSDRSRKPAIQIKVESVRKKIAFGDNITVSINVKMKNGELKETRLFVDSTEIYSGKETEITQTLKKFQQLGKHTIRAEAEKTDGVKGVYYRTFEVFSDVVPEKYGFKLINSFPHDTSSYTEGLEIHDGFLYESTGRDGRSRLLKTDLTSGKIIKAVKLANKYFGEGITIFDDKIYQLTYKQQKGFIYQLNTMARVDSFSFESKEGWGMTHDDKNLIMSDGSNVLTYLDPATLKPVKRLQVYDDKNAMVFLNELEYSDGVIYANIWGTFLIVKIDPETGKVLWKIDLDGILMLSNLTDHVDVLNGIAIDLKTKKMYVTGKLYPLLYEIKPIKKE